MSEKDTLDLKLVKESLYSIIAAMEKKTRDDSDTDFEEEEVKELQSRPYQDEFLEKAKKNNIIVYLGTGSGKTYIAIMLIKHLRAELRQGGKKAIFLVNSVPLVDQQSDAIRKMTGLEVGSFCGADGVDDWDEEKWRQETGKYQVLVLVHQVFLDLLTHSFFKLTDAAVMVMDECHHAQSVKDHPYTKIMKDWYHQHKQNHGAGDLPKILGLTACLMVKNVTLEKFHREKNILEQIMDSKVETTENLYEILQHVTCPDEFTVKFDDAGTNLNGSQLEIMKLCTKTIGDLDNIYREEKENIGKSTDGKNFQQTAKQDLERHFKAMKNDILSQLSSGVSHLGIIAFFLKFQSKKLEFMRLTAHTQNAYYNNDVKNKMSRIMNHCMEKLTVIYNTIQDPRTLNSLEAMSSKKLMKLIEILRKNTDCRTLVFVEQKFSAEAICSILEKFANLDVELRAVKPDFAFSPGAKMNPKDPDQRQFINEERKKLKTTLANFRIGATNTLVSTSVVEEGLDVRSCNLVIKFDFPTPFRAYVQSKGRARAKPSKYMMMIGESEAEKKMKQYKEYRELEQMSLRECHYRQEEKDAWDNVEFDPPYIADPADPGSARITGSQAVRLVHKYVDKIKVDRFTRLTVVWETEKIQGLGSSSKSGYQTTCYMPHKTPFTAPVIGDIRPGKKASKQSAALLIVELLHQNYAELDNRLKVRKRKYDVDEEDDEEDDDSGYNPNNRKVGTKKKRQFYQTQYPDSLRIRSRTNLNLSIFSISLVKLNNNYKYKTYDPAADTHSLGILTSEVMPQIAPINLYHPGGHYQASITEVKNILLTEDEMDMVRNFQQYLVDTVWKIDRVEEQCGDALVVPVNTSLKKIDVALLGEILNNNVSSAKRCHLDNYSLSSDSVVYPMYKNTREHYFIEMFVPKEIMSVDSKMPDEKITFREYYKTKYGLSPHQDQNLIKPSFADRRSYMLLPGEQLSSTKSPGQLKKTTYFVPEFMGVEPVTSGLWIQLQMFPFILHRISSMISAQNLLQSLKLDDHQQHLDLERRSVSGRHLFERLIVFGHQRYRAPSIGDVVQAVTLKAANDQFDMERLEILGDCFLKYYTGIFLYYKLLEQETVNTEEGDLSSKRSRVVGNKNLCKIAQSLHLDQCIISAQMDLASTWLPPGFTSLSLENKLIELDQSFADKLSSDRKKTVSVGGLLNWIREEEMGLVLTDPEDLISRAVERCESKTETSGVKMRNHKLIADKSMADCVEALIGCFMMTSGQQGALTFMSRVGINLSSSNTVEDLLARKRGDGAVQQFQAQSDAFIDDHTRLTDADRANELYAKLGVEEIENIVGYTFKDKSFLLQAFTHASFCENRLTRSYERLEFMGDAVLDYLVTVHVFTHLEDNVGPGQITDIRSALVCNNMFASVLVHHGLHHFIQIQSPKLFNMILSYVEDLRAEQVQTNLNLINEEEPPELEYVEVPKVLGDVFESLMGAIFIDSGHDLSVVWRIFKKMFPHLDDIIRSPPVNAKKELLEKFAGREVRISYEAPSSVRNTVSAVVSVDGKKYKGLGMNKRSAELAACKIALRLS